MPLPAERKARPHARRRRDLHGHNHWVVVATCIVTAFGLWLLLSLDEPGEIRLELQTTVTNQAENVAFAAIPARSVMATVRGDVLTLFKLRFRPPRFVLDASLDTIESPDAVSWPQGVTAVFDSPRITLVQEERVRHKVPVVSRVAIQPVAGFSLFTEPALTPDSVVVEGADSIVRSIHSWPTEPVRRVGVRSLLSVEVSLLDTLHDLVTLSHDAVMLEAQPHRYTEGLRELRVIVTDISNAESIVDLYPPTVEVRFHAPLSQFNAVQEAEDFYVTVSYEAIRLDTTGSVTPQVTLPANLLARHVGTQPSSLRYYVNIGLQ